MLWESLLPSKNVFPVYSQMIDFLETRARSLEAAQGDSFFQQGPSHNKNKVSSFNTMIKGTSDNLRCSLCKGAHATNFCRKFKKLSVDQRRSTVQRDRLCFNGLRPGHTQQECPSKNTCQKCHTRHHTLLHLNTIRNSNAQKPSSNDGANSVDSVHAATQVASNLIVLQNTTSGTVLMATAQVAVENAHGHSIVVRALRDSGAQRTFVSERVVQQLRLPKKKVNVPINGL